MVLDTNGAPCCCGGGGGECIPSDPAVCAGFAEYQSVRTCWRPGFWLPRCYRVVRDIQITADVPYWVLRSGHSDSERFHYLMDAWLHLELMVAFTDQNGFFDGWRSIGFGEKLKAGSGCIQFTPKAHAKLLPGSSLTVTGSGYFDYPDISIAMTAAEIEAATNTDDWGTSGNRWLPMLHWNMNLAGTENRTKLRALAVAKLGVNHPVWAPLPINQFFAEPIFDSLTPVGQTGCNFTIDKSAGFGHLIPVQFSAEWGKCVSESRAEYAGTAEYLIYTNGQISGFEEEPISGLGTLVEVVTPIADSTCPACAEACRAATQGDPGEIGGGQAGPLDPAVAAILDLQARGGGCRGCSE